MSNGDDPSAGTDTVDEIENVFCIGFLGMRKGGAIGGGLLDTTAVPARGDTQRRPSQIRARTGGVTTYPGRSGMRIPKDEGSSLTNSFHMR